MITKIIDDFLFEATILKRKCDPSSVTTERYINSDLFKKIFGLTPKQVAVTWELIYHNILHDTSFKKKHLLWTLKFLRHYPTKACLSFDVGADGKTLMKWVWYTINCLCNLKVVGTMTTAIYHIIQCIFNNINILQIKFNNRFRGSINGQKAFLTVDGVHFQIYEESPFNKQCFSHKFNRAGITYEIGANVQTGDICWAFGGFRAGIDDLTMARKGILNALPVGEKIIADKGYRGEHNKIITPTFLEGDPRNRELKRIMARHEGINKRLKDFKCLRSIWRHGWKMHIRAFYAVVTLTQIKFENGDPMPPPY